LPSLFETVLNAYLRFPIGNGFQSLCAEGLFFDSDWGIMPPHHNGRGAGDGEQGGHKLGYGSALARTDVHKVMECLARKDSVDGGGGIVRVQKLTELIPASPNNEWLTRGLASVEFVDECRDDVGAV
jgi:hypothetical protein